QRVRASQRPRSRLALSSPIPPRGNSCHQRFLKASDNQSEYCCPLLRLPSEPAHGRLALVHAVSRPISPSFCCHRSAQSSTRSRTSGSSCATTGSPTASSNPTTISSTIVVRHGTSSSISLGASCPSDCANGPTGSDQWDLVISHPQKFAATRTAGSLISLLICLSQEQQQPPTKNDRSQCCRTCSHCRSWTRGNSGLPLSSQSLPCRGLRATTDLSDGPP